MFDPSLIPEPNEEITQILEGLIVQSTASEETQKVVKVQLERIDNHFSQAIIEAPTVSEYFESLWNAQDIKPAHKEYVTDKLEECHDTKVEEILAERIFVRETELNIEDDILSNAKIGKYQKHMLDEKIKELSKVQDYEGVHKIIKLNTFGANFIDVMKYVSRPFYSKSSHKKENLHFSALGVYIQQATDLEEEHRFAQAEEFVKKVQSDKKEFERKIQNIAQREEMRLKEEYEKYRQKELEQEQEKMERKKLELDENIKKINERKEERVKNKTLWEEDSKKYQQAEPLYKQMEKKYNEQVELPTLEQKKQRLKEIRELHKPLDHDMFVEHEKRILVKKEEIRSRATRLPDHKFARPSYESPFHKQFDQEAEKARRYQEEEFEAKKHAREKMQEFAANVKKPVVSKKKELELKAMMTKLTDPPKKRRPQRLDENGDPLSQTETLSPRTQGLENLKLARKAKKYDSIQEERAKKDEGKTVSLNQSASIYQNYWTDVKKRYNIRAQSDSWKQVMSQKDLSSQGRKDQVLMEADRLENKAKMKEQLWRASLNQKKYMEKYLDEADEVDDMYLNSIKAKLAVLMDQGSDAKDSVAVSRSMSNTKEDSRARNKARKSIAFDPKSNVLTGVTEEEESAR